ncbi:MAG: ABC transporter ATP-binding protein [Dehalococcoidales bacterium]|nr:MAG: ABC transporter ATP-binding protein [Dehalococcoidales bacterium]
MNDKAILVDGLGFSYGKLKVLNDLTLEIPSGTSFGLLGPNGSGKTTLIKLLVGLLKPGYGDIRCLGRHPSSSNAKMRGYMPQLPSLYSELTVRHNIDFFARIYGLKNRKERGERVDEVIKLVDLWDKRNTQVMHLSGGMKQRVSLGCAIVHSPPLIFLDEPTVGLDPDVRVNFWEYFRTLTSAGVTIVISSHTMDDAAHCDKLVFLRQGMVIAMGTPGELRAATGDTNASLEDAFLYFIRKTEEVQDAQ